MHSECLFFSGFCLQLHLSTVLPTEFIASKRVTGQTSGVQAFDEGAWLTRLEQMLRAAPAGMSEHEMLVELCGRAESPFVIEVFDNNLSLFRAHFFLFHLLYRLRQKLWSEGDADLDIGCLNISLRQRSDPTRETPVEYDPLESYYLDLRHWHETTEEQIQEMLGDFWRIFAGRDARRDALSVLGLDADAEPETIKRRYHQLALEHHPDRGGDAERLRQINAAMAIVKRELLKRNAR